MRFNLILIITAVGFLCCNSKSSDGQKTKDSTTTTATTATTTTASVEESNFQYNLAKPQKQWTLDPSLLEISGIAWMDKSHLLAIEDLTPNLYVLNLDKDGSIESKMPFMSTDKAKFDIEDVTLANGIAYVLWSHGDIYQVQNWQKKPEAKTWETGLSKDNNTEGLCFDPVSGNLLVACKNEAGVADEKKSTRAIYSFDINKGQLNKEPFMVINRKDFKKIGGDKIDFNPSAIAIHPKTKDIYVLSTKGTKCLAEFNRQGKLVSFQYIDKELMPQPEGMTFAPDGTLYISTEGKDALPGKVLQFNSK